MFCWRIGAKASWTVGLVHAEGWRCECNIVVEIPSTTSKILYSTLYMSSGLKSAMPLLRLQPLWQGFSLNRSLALRVICYRVVW